LLSPIISCQRREGKHGSSTGLVPVRSGRRRFSRLRRVLERNDDCRYSCRTSRFNWFVSQAHFEPDISGRWFVTSVGCSVPAVGLGIQPDTYVLRTLLPRVATSLRVAPVMGVEAWRSS
jgi:hypothetical protein